jgi:hypothetical protein
MATVELYKTGGSVKITTWDGSRSTDMRFVPISTSNATKENEPVSLTDKLFELTAKEPLKTFVKAGVKTKEGKLTPEGQELLMNLVATQPDIEKLLLEAANKLTADEKAAK